MSFSSFRIVLWATLWLLLPGAMAFAAGNDLVAQNVLGGGVFGDVKRSGGGGYVGPGDVQSGAVFWGGLRGYTAAYASPGTNPAVDLVDQAGTNPITINILSNGNLDVASISTWVAAHSVTTICVKQLYDQTGNGLHLSNATVATMPTIVLNAFGSLPGLLFTRGNSSVLSRSGGFGAAAQPFTWSMVYDRNSSGFTSFAAHDAGASDVLAGGTTTSTFTINAGSNGSATAADSALHAIQSIFNGASSSIIVEGSSTGVSVGTTGMQGNNFALGLAFGQGHQGYINEFGFYPSNIGSVLNSNQRTYWGI
jgi:hypothetical protein